MRRSSLGSRDDEACDDDLEAGLGERPERARLDDSPDLDGRRSGVLDRRSLLNGDRTPDGYRVLASSLLRIVMPNCLVRQLTPSTLEAWPRPPHTTHTHIALMLDLAIA